MSHKCIGSKKNKRFENSWPDLPESVRSSVVVETFPRPFRDLGTCLNFEIVRYIKIPTTEAIESNDLNIENL